jgi:hypothetical protein
MSGQGGDILDSLSFYAFQIFIYMGRDEDGCHKHYPIEAQIGGVESE